MTDDPPDDRDPYKEAQAVAGASQSETPQTTPDTESTASEPPDAESGDTHYECGGCAHHVADHEIAYVISHPRGHDETPACSLSCAKEAMGHRDVLRKYQLTEDVTFEATNE